MTSRVIRLAACQRYFRIMKFLKHGPIVGKQMGKGAMLEQKNGKNTHLLVGGRGVAQKPVEPSERREKRLKSCAVGEEGGGRHGYVCVGVHDVDGKGRNST